MVRYKFPDPVTGRRRETKRVSIPTRREAQEVLNRMGGEVYTDSVPTDVTKTKVEDGWALFASHWDSLIRAGRYKQATFSSYDSAWRTHLCDRWGDRQMSEVRPAHITALFADFAQLGLSNSRRKTLWHVARSCFKHAMQNGLIGTTPFARLDRRDVIEGERSGLGRDKAWTRPEVEAFLAALADEGHEYEWLWRLVLLTGLRKGEAMALRDNDFNGNTLSVTRQWAYDSSRRGAQLGAGWPKGCYFDTPKTDHSRRTFGVSDAVLHCVREQKRRRAEWRLALPGRWPDDSGLLFTKPNGLLPHTHTPLYHLKKFCERHSIRFVGLHGLRHTFATLGLDAGVATKMVSDTLGHARTDITTDTYMHTNTDMTRRASEEVASALGF
jgi:integrase